MNGTHLTGLTGNNPLGFLAALGVQVLFDHEEDQPRLWWTDDIIPHAVVDARFDVERIIDQAITISLPAWRTSPALNPRMGDKSDDTAKFTRDNLRTYLDRANSDEPGNRFSTVLVAEGSYDGNGAAAKPSDLYFAAGPAKFLSDARKILDEVGPDDLKKGLLGPWPFDSNLPSFRWDVGDDPNYALAATKPGVDKQTSPGPEALGLLGLSRFPVFGSTGRTLTQGCSGPWRRNGTFTWPIWTRPAGPKAVKSLLAHVAFSQQPTPRSSWYQSWGISMVMNSTIKRSDQGGYGNMSPPQFLRVGG